jgi:hypothetical protein
MLASLDLGNFTLAEKKKSYSFVVFYVYRLIDHGAGG